MGEPDGSRKMRTFKHYITTRFNVGLYGPDAGIRVSTDEWMKHRITLFKTFTLPSIMGQSCQNFTWLVLIDSRTPGIYREMLQSIQYPNMKLVQPGTVQNPWLTEVEPGECDLITTRIDNDDAFHKDVVKVIQDSWHTQRGKKTEPWVIVFPYGFILDLAARKMSVLEYWFNNCPTLVENCRNPRTVWQWDHSNIPPHVDKHYISDKPYWLQVIHSHNLKNEIPIDSRAKIIHRDIPARLQLMSSFGVDVGSLPDG
jgi:hypothetical protein